MALVINIRACDGCRACELACSLHLSKTFSPNLSAIKVLTSMRTGKITWSIDSTCDFCKGEVQPLCVKYCAYGALYEVR